jgi:hypothetical protein
MATVVVEGIRLTLDDAICKTDKSLKDALTPHFPAVANAEIKRKTEGENTTITVTKKAGTKGLAAVVDALLQAPERISPIILIEASGEKSNPTKLDEAILQMFDEAAEISRVAHTLETAAADPSKTLPTGF